MQVKVTRHPLEIKATQVANLLGVKPGYLRTLRFEGTLNPNPRAPRLGALYDLGDVATVSVYRSLREAGLPVQCSQTLTRMTEFPVALFLEHMPGVARFEGVSFELNDDERLASFAACNHELPESRFCYYALPGHPDDDPAPHAQLVTSLDELETIHPRGLALDFEGLAREIAGRITSPLVRYVIEEVVETDA